MKGKRLTNYHKFQRVLILAMILLLLATANLGGRKRLKNFYLVYGRVIYLPLTTLVLDQRVLDLKRLVVEHQVMSR